MAAPALTAPQEFTPLKHLTVYVVNTIANTASPTRTELNAGTDVTRHIPKQGITGFTKSANVVQADNLKTGAAVSLDDGYTLDQSSIQFYLSQNGTTSDIRSVLSEGQATNLVFFENTDTTGKLMDVWPVLVQTISKSKQGGQANLLTVAFQVSTPTENVTVP